MFPVQQVSIAVLCKDNPLQLETTLLSLPVGAKGLDVLLEILVMDASESRQCEEVADRFQLQFLPLEMGVLRHCYQSTTGIYAAMNEVIQLACGDLLAFMNSGDYYLSEGLTGLVEHWRYCSEAVARPLPAVFAQTWATVPGGIRWLTPSPLAHRMRRWMSGMVPCHQAILFEITFARQNPYHKYSLIADRSVMRKALSDTTEFAYLSKPVCVFLLDGVSSQWPSWSVLRGRWSDSERNLLEHGVEMIKFILFPLRGLRFRMMRMKARLWGLICCW